jgi:hypothetical protein
MHTDDEFAYQLESRLMGQGLYLSELAYLDSGYRIEYESLSADRGAMPQSELGDVINIFRDVLEDDWPGTAIEAVITDFEGQPVAEWHVRAAWSTLLAEGDLSEIEFSDRVLGTLSSL